MKNVYNEENIKNIKEYIKTNAYATNYTTPLLNILVVLVLLFTTLYLITITNNYYVLTILILGIALVLIKTFMIFHDLCHKSYFPTDERKEKKKGFNMSIAKILDLDI